MNVWFLTMVVNGRVNLISITADDHKDAVTQSYGVFAEQLGRKAAWAMSDNYLAFRPTVDVWEIENVEGMTVIATLIKS